MRTFAQGLNDRGQITGYGNLVSGGIRGFVLTPLNGSDAIPEPGTLALASIALLAGMGGWINRCRRQRSTMEPLG
ncbi:protein of unknown function DUF1555 [Isosphaera pallida ATCC 43644]|uniref:Ice-binding protein C-terminal domain-containing protein n=1 Tax=Isosphaera pallida (strain ATCC 43644 / DSM 9630 / IS1B) TaxID=575540 RepID=E8QWS0_ISOPI|nr:PEP-CTERM sorting domain-containing protein [Isosphaera pallida]ADV62970.1 protein of unknown function DUF1555 [Isosphaera pallida ATCC 43644]